MDEIEYRMLKLLYKHKKFPVSEFTNKKLYGSEYLKADKSELEQAKIILSKNDYIGRNPVDWFYLTNLGEHEFKRERRKRVKAYFEKNWQWILAAVTMVSALVSWIIRK